MNNDLISRSELRKAVNDFYDNHFKGLVPNELITYAEAVDNFIDNAPTVEQITVFCENADEKTIEDLKVELQKVKSDRHQCNQIVWEQGYEAGYAQGYVDGSTGADWRGEE